MSLRKSLKLALLTTAFAVAALTGEALAQQAADQPAQMQSTSQTPAPAQNTAAALPGEPQPSKFDLIGEYDYFDPRASISGVHLHSFDRGFAIRGTYWLNKWAGLSIDEGFHLDNGQGIKLQNYTFGPEFRFPGEHLTPFVHGSIGAMHFTAPGPGLRTFGVAGMIGGGVDAPLTHNFAWRVIDANILWAHTSANFSTIEGAGPDLRTGLVWKVGSIGPPPPPPTAACSVQPTEAFAGEPVKATVTPSNFNPKRTLVYSWSGNGVKINNGNTATADIDTTGMQPGQYSLRSTVTDGKKGMADCTANFTVKQPQPPTISCSANPASVDAGQSSTISCQGASPDNRPLTYKHSANGANLTENGPNATLNTAGAQPGPINVESTVTDDRNLSANTTTTVTVNQPPPPPPPPAQASKLNSINFKRNNARVDNAAKAVLDDVALRLQREPDSKLVIDGSTDPKEHSKTLAAQRAVNTKAYLTQEKGIDPSRIEVRSSSGEGMTSTMWIVPAGATAPDEGTPVNESKVKATATGHAKAHKKAVKKKAAAK